MNIKIVEDKIKLDELKEIAKEFYTSMIKGVVDIEKEVIAFGGEYHIDAKKILLKKGSEDKDIWGFSIYFDRSRDSFLEYKSQINVQPTDDNNGLEVQNENIRAKMKRIIDSKIV